VAPQERSGGRPVREYQRGTSRSRPVFLATGLIFLAACAVLGFQRPGLDRSGNALQPAHGEAQTTLDEMTVELGLPPQPLWLIVPGATRQKVDERLVAAEKLLNDAATNRLIGRYLLPDTLWPRGEFQSANRAAAAVLAPPRAAGCARLR